MEGYAWSDLACESVSDGDLCVSGAEWSTRVVGGFRVGHLFIPNEETAQKLQRPIGNYITVESGRMNTLGEEERLLLAHLLSEELRRMAEELTGKLPDADFEVFVAGLGNAELTADAIGPKTVRMLTATRHLREHEQFLYRIIGCSALSALAPGVLGQTGIETLELLKGAVSHVKPDLIVVVDALAARSCKRLASTVQLSDTGISPGSGVGNHRMAITRETLGVPVVVLGVPTVVNSATLVYDALQEAGIEEISDPLREVLETGKSFFVSPKESDVITEQVAHLLSDAIGMAFTGNL